MSRWVAIPAAAACLVAAVLFVPFLARDRELVASTPSPRPLFSVTFVSLPAGGRLCASDVTIPHDARVLRFQARTFGRPGPALSATLSAPGYAARAQVGAGYADETTLALPFRAPALTKLGRVCIARAGEAPLALVGSAEERTQSRPRNTVDGHPVSADAYLTFSTGRTGSAISQAPAIVDRMTAFRPGVLGPWLLWPVLVLTVLGVPAGIAWALRRALP